MPARTDQAVSQPIKNLEDVSKRTTRKELFWLKGKRTELDVYQIPTTHLYFNIENGRYADKMLQLRQDNPNVNIDPREMQWKAKILKMLKGEYLGTEPDRSPFEKLKEDMEAKLQLRPGVVLYDGGVLDGNRRLAVLLDLQSTSRNATRFEYFDGVILPPDVGPEDRWRIEAGLQLGREEKNPYSPINQLLKIREGMQLFRRSKNAANEIANALYGIPKEDVAKDIAKIALIDEYLTFMQKPRAYNAVSGMSEQFEEATKSLAIANRQGWPPARVRKLKLTIFAVLRDQTMDNWQMREIWRAMGIGKAKKQQNEEALEQFLEIGENAISLQKDLSSDSPDGAAQQGRRDRAEDFLEQMEVAKKADRPGQLARSARKYLDRLETSLQDILAERKSDSKDKIRDLPSDLQKVLELASDCFKLVREIQKMKTQ